MVLAFSLNNLNMKYAKFFSILFLLVFLLNNDYIKSRLIPSNDKYVNVFKRQNLMIDVCKELRFDIKSKQFDATLFEFKYWHNKFDNEKIDLLCKELDI